MISPDSRAECRKMVTLAEPGEDVELKAIAYIGSVMNELPEESRARVADYILGRYGSPQKK